MYVTADKTSCYWQRLCYLAHTPDSSKSTHRTAKPTMSQWYNEEQYASERADPNKNHSKVVPVQSTSVFIIHGKVAEINAKQKSMAFNLAGSYGQSTTEPRWIVDLLYHLSCIWVLFSSIPLIPAHFLVHVSIYLYHLPYFFNLSDHLYNQHFQTIWEKCEVQRINM